MFKSKKFILFIFFLMCFTALGGLVLADRATEVTYPVIPGAIQPTTTKMLLPEYVKYLFNFLVVVSGFIVFGSLVYAGFVYLTSSVNPSALSEARDRISSSLIGLAIILSSYLILTTVNPQLTILGVGLSAKWGIVLYDASSCSGNFKEITTNTPDLEDDFNDKTRSIEFKAPKGTLDLEVYPQTDYKPEDGFVRVKSEDATDISGKICIEFSASSSRSIKFVWNLPGVYLINNQGLEKFLPADTATLGDFDNKVEKIRFRNTENVKFGAVLHEHQDWQGKCQVFASQDSLSGRLGWITMVPENELQEITGLVEGKVSSVTTFSPVPTSQAIGGGVTFYEHNDFGGESFGPFKEERINVGEVSGFDDNMITSIKIEGNYIAVLFEHADAEGRCEVFTRNDSNLRDNPIGRCHCGPFGWGCGDCLSSFIIIPTR